jgi:hypothetical protein
MSISNAELNRRIALYIENVSPDSDPVVVRLCVQHGFTELDENGRPTLTEKGRFAADVAEDIHDV